PYALPPHTLQNLQPLNVVVFQPYKYYHKARVEQHVRLRGSNFNKIEFLYAIKILLILIKLRIINRPVTLPVDKPSYLTTLQTPVTKLAKGAVAVSAAYEIQAQELYKLTAALQHRNKRQIQDKRVIQLGRTVTVNDARLRVAKRAIADKKKGVVHKSAREMAVLMAQEEAGPSRSTLTL
ncbi:hypothetical protein GQ44DRAFT_705997, partial [Phaeosphaeriaceae sp. PMI808]